MVQTIGLGIENIIEDVATRCDEKRGEKGQEKGDDLPGQLHEDERLALSRESDHRADENAEHRKHAVGRTKDGQIPLREIHAPWLLEVPSGPGVTSGCAW